MGIVLSTNFRRNAYIPIAIIGTLLGVRSAFSYQNPIDLPQRALASIKAPRNTKFIKGNKIDLSKLGNIFIKPEKLDEILKLQKITDIFLREGETYYDLTNRSAMHFVLDKRVPGVWSSDYAAAGYKWDKKTLDALKKDIPLLVWIAPSMRFDGGPASLRSYRIYRWLLQQNYRYYAQDGFEFLVRKDRLLECGIENLSEEENLARLSQVFHQKELRSIPISWGRNLQTLQQRFEKADLKLDPVHVNHVVNDNDNWLKVTGSNPYIIWKLPGLLNGGQFDFVAINIECWQECNSQFEGQVFWTQTEKNRKTNRSNLISNTVIC